MPSFSKLLQDTAQLFEAKQQRIRLLERGAAESVRRQEAFIRLAGELLQMGAPVLEKDRPRWAQAEAQLKQLATAFAASPTGVGAVEPEGGPRTGVDNPALQAIEQAIELGKGHLQLLRQIDQFLTNGIELGFIRMPDPQTKDPASALPGLVKRAIARTEARAEGGDPDDDSALLDFLCRQYGFTREAIRGVRDDPSIVPPAASTRAMVLGEPTPEMVFAGAHALKANGAEGSLDDLTRDARVAYSAMRAVLKEDFAVLPGAAGEEDDGRRAARPR